MHRENNEETLEIMWNCFLALEKMGVYSLYTRQYLDSARGMLSLQRALSAANRNPYGCHSQGILEIESLEDILSKMTYPSKV